MFIFIHHFSLLGCILSKRKKCTVCEKALKACICSTIKSINTKIELIILQHPSEVKNAIGTARILNLSLDNCNIVVGENFTDNAQVNQYLTDVTRDCYLLYPSELSSELCAEKIKSNKIQTYFLLDGTWKKAYKMYQLSGNLQLLPAVTFPHGFESDYRIRQSSVTGSLSTVEAGYYLLSILESDDDKFQPLLNTFNHMINFQIASMPNDVFKNNYNNASCNDEKE